MMVDTANDTLCQKTSKQYIATTLEYGLEKFKYTEL